MSKTTENPQAESLRQHYSDRIKQECPRFRHEPADAYARRLLRWMKENKPTAGKGKNPKKTRGTARQGEGGGNDH